MNKINLWQIIKLLRDTKGWQRSELSLFTDDITHKKSSVRFYLDQQGVIFRIGFEEVYTPSILVWLFIIIPLTNRLKETL